MSEKARHIFWLAGENSADLHTGMVMRSLNEALPGLRHSGIGGPRMQNEGLISLYPFSRFNVMGFTEVLGHLNFFREVESGIKVFLQKDPPDLAILVDYPGLNLRIARLARKQGIPVLYFICPQFWAWRPGRINQLRDRVSHVACILPFEQRLLAAHNVPATYVGHPIGEEIAFGLDRPTFASICELDPAKPWIGFLPGSRDSVVRRMLPVYLEAARALARKGFEVLVSQAGTVSPQLIHRFCDTARIPGLKVIEAHRYELMCHSKLLVCTSGTATLEAAWLGTPQIICYKSSPISFAIGRRLVRIKRIGLPNIVLEQDLLPELIQNDCQPRSIVKVALSLLSDPSRLEAIKTELARLRGMLSEPRTSVEMTHLVQQLLSDHG